VLGEAREPTPYEGGHDEVVAALAKAARKAAKDADIAADELGGVGVGWPGDVDGVAGTVGTTVNLAEWKGSFPLADRLADAVGTEVKVGNDVQVATDAEFHLGAGRPYESMLGVFWGTGVGGGLILDGAPWIGRGAAGEIGHMVVELDGAQCPCGRRGCMEAYAGRRAMEAEARRLLEAGESTDLFKIMQKRGADRL
jgi:glucokinase